MSDPAPSDVSFPARRTKLWLESRYRKLRRGLPQTVFFCPDCKGDRRRRTGCERCGGFGKLTRESVQELIARRLLPAMQAKGGRFHGAGREDVDVLMLGRGRPFVFEVIGARRDDVDLEQLRAEIVQRAEGAIELAPFVRVPRQRLVYWKQEHFEKIYRADVAIDDVPDAAALTRAASWSGAIVQRTPQRVSHRRADLDRERRLRVLALAPSEPGMLELRVLCEHGTYVKEWISGDEGRTDPSLASVLGVGARCAVLDVEEILTDDVPGPRLTPKAGTRASAEP